MELRTSFNPLPRESEAFAILEFLNKNYWRHGNSYSSLVTKIVEEIVVGSFDPNFKIPATQSNVRDGLKVTNLSTQIPTRLKRGLMNVSERTGVSMARLFEDQLMKHIEV